VLQVFLVEYSLVHFAPYGEFFLAVVIAVVDEQCYGYLAGCVEVGGERDVDNVAGGMQDAVSLRGSSRPLKQSKSFVSIFCTKHIFADRDRHCISSVG